MLPVGIVAAVRPWPVTALEAALGLAHEGSATVARLAPLSSAAASLAGDNAGAHLLLAQGEALLGGGSPGRAVDVYQRLLSRPDLPAIERATGLWMLGKAC